MASEEFLKEFMDQAKGSLDKGTYQRLHNTARRSAGGKARANRLAKLKVEGVTPEGLANASTQDVLDTYKKLESMYTSAKKSGRSVEDFLLAAEPVGHELTKRKVKRDKDSPFYKDAAKAQKLAKQQEPGDHKVLKGLVSGEAESGVHAHGLLRNDRRTRVDGAHMHMFLVELEKDRTLRLFTMEDGEHAHTMDESRDAKVGDDISAHGHGIRIEDDLVLASGFKVSAGARFFTEDGGGKHNHGADMLESTNFDGGHKHTLVLPDGTRVESLDITTFWDTFGPFDMGLTPPMPPASAIVASSQMVVALQEGVNKTKEEQEADDFMELFEAALKTADHAATDEAQLALAAMGHLPDEITPDVTTKNKGEEETAEIMQARMEALDEAFAGETPILKVNKRKKLVYGIVQNADKFDFHDDTINEEELEKTAHFFMKSGAQMGKEHVGKARAQVVENMVLKKGDKFNGKRLQHTAWIIGVHVQDPKLWQDIESGKVRAFSPGGMALRRPAK